MKATWLVLALAAPLMAADVTGAWSGKIVVTDPSSGEQIDTQVQAQFDQKAEGISGKIGRVHDQDLEQIRNAKLDGKTLVFEVQPPEATSPMKFNLVIVSDDRIEGDMKGAIDSGNISGKVVLTRAAAGAPK
ncbi:MAG TPA: hypothetical protein VKX45_15835 [Bryobacteraceae bacterium]|jgi:hypothetical protein|nr:hypothetical protein [Bryobacteraceae bacterium]